MTDMPVSPRRAARVTGGLLFVLLLFNSCARNPVTGKKDFMLMSTDQEIAMGKQSDPEVTAFFGLYDDKQLQQFINEKGQQMAAVSHRKDLKYQFKVVDSPVVNAFAVPGGYVYFTRGIMAHFNNEAEFAGVLGHEIGHITARHSAKQYSRSMLAQLGLVAGMVLSPEFARFGDAAQQGLGLLFLKFGRDAESESDRLGVEYSSQIGYDAQEMADFFKTLERMGDKKGERVPEFLSTHPDPSNRNARVTKLAAEYKAKTGLTNAKVNRNSYLKMIDGLVYGEDPKQGFREGNAFYHPELRFQFPVPQGWNLQNTPQQVQMAPGNGNALMMLALAPGKSAQEAAQAVVKQYQLQVVESGTSPINGLPAVTVVADQASEQGTVRTLLSLIEYGGQVYMLMGATSAKQFGQYFPLFSNTIGGFRQLTDPEKINRQPERIRVVPVRRAGTLSTALRDYQAPEGRLHELAVLNGMELNERVEAGTLVKTLSRYQTPGDAIGNK